MGFPIIKDVNVNSIGDVDFNQNIQFPVPVLEVGQLLLSVVVWRSTYYEFAPRLDRVSSSGHIDVVGVPDDPYDIGLAVYGIQRGEQYWNRPNDPGTLSIYSRDYVSDVMVATILFDGGWWGADFSGITGDHIECPSVTSPANGTLSYRLGANFSESGGPYSGISVFESVLGDLRFFMSAHDSSVGPRTYPADSNAAPADPTHSNVGMTLWVSADEAPYQDMSGFTPCPQLRHRQRDDHAETPRVTTVMNNPTSVGSSFRRGFHNTYDGPNICTEQEGPSCG